VSVIPRPSAIGSEAPGPLHAVAAFARLIRLSHTAFALPFAVMALFLASGGPPRWPASALVLGCVLAARSAAMAFNRVADVRIDAGNRRTRHRPLQTGRISLAAAWVFFAACCAAFVALASLFWVYLHNLWPLAASVPVLILLCGYSYTKRFTWLSHFILGTALAAAPVGVWVAVSPATLGPAAFLLGAAVLCWVAGFDILYALQDLQADRRQRLWSVPVRFGPAGALAASRILHAAAVVLLVALAPVAALRWVYLSGVLAATILMTIQQSRVSLDDLAGVGAVFGRLNAATSCVVAAAAVVDVLTIGT